MAHKVLEDIMQIHQVDQLLEEVFIENEEQVRSNSAGRQPTQMDDSELKTIINAEMGQSYGEENSELASDRARALDYYFNRPRGDEIPGKSQVQSSDVMDVIEWMLPDIIEAFTTNDNAVSFKANSAEDEQSARNETAYINQIFYSDCNGYLMLYDFFKDALLQKNGIAKVFRDDRIEIRYAEYTEVTEIELEQILAGDEDTEAEVLELEENEKLLTELSPESQQEAKMLPQVQEQMKQIMMEAQQNAVQALEESGENSMVMTQETQMMMQQYVQESAAEALESIVVTLYNVKLR
ncbi:MAG: hypothetical protein V3R78_12615, partial [Thermodesulfobacteriota bacterium]